MAKAVYGLTNAKMGTTGANGAMGATLADITQIVEDSVTMTFPAPTLNPITPEESDSPFVVLETKGPKVLTLQTLNLDISALPAFFGGAVATGTYTPGVNFSIGEKSVQFTTRQLQGTAQTWKFPRVQVFASIDTVVNKKDVMKVTLTYNVLQPFDAGGLPLADFSVVQA